MFHIRNRGATQIVDLKLPLIILIEGFVSIAIEIMTIRQLQPVAGSSVVVTSLIIGIFLLFLALGYRHGGRIDKHLESVLSRNFFISALWLGIGLSYIFIALFFYSVQQLVGHYVLYPLIIYLLVITAPLVFILGQTMPITMNMAKLDKKVGTVGGDTLSLSTIGSFFGATATSLICMNYFGVAWTIFFNSALLFMLFIVLRQGKPLLLFYCCIVLSTLWIIYSFNIQMENRLFVSTNNYANYQIFHPNDFNLKNDEKILAINNALSSFTNSKRQGFQYIENIKKILFEDLGLRDANILVLGAGGFTLSAQSDYGNHITYVDIDGKLKNIVSSGFLHSHKETLIADDARHYIHSTNERYDAIVVDAYSDIRAIPAYLITYEFMHELQARLNKRGTIIFNVIANPTLTDPYSKRVDNTIRAVFQNCMSQPLKYRNGIANILYICNHATNNDKTVYTDNRNTSTTDSFEW